MKKSQNKKEGEVKSPCINKCSLNGNKICPACYRSIDEIVSWADADNLMRQKILEAAKFRRDQAKR